MASASEKIGRFFERVCGGNSTKLKRDREGESHKIRGRVVLMKKNLMDMNDRKASFIDSIYELLGKQISMQLISATHADPENNLRGKIGKSTHLQKWSCTGSPLTAKETELIVTFDWEDWMGVPGALRVSNHHHSEFYLSSVTLEGVPGQDRIHFVCNSWVFPVRIASERVFFSNQAYLPCHTPEPLRHYREEELLKLRGNGQGQRKTYERIYDYDVYNDLGTKRNVLGGSEYPYPRRGRTGRKLTKSSKIRGDKNPWREKRLPMVRLDIYVPRDERFSQVKFSDFLAYAAKSLVQVALPEVRSLFDKTINEFDSLEDVLDIYDVRTTEANREICGRDSNCISWEFIREVSRSDVGFRKFPMPDVIKESKSAWRTDEEFAREMLAGVNPLIIRLLKEFPPASKLDVDNYGNQTSTITKEHIEKNMNGLTVNQAIECKKLFILDYHDTLMPFLCEINSTETKTYASRTLLYLQEDGTLKPLAIELSLPHPQGQKYGATSQVYTPPAEEGVEGSIWQLAKAYVAVNDSGYHQLISHWLHTHATIEPFVIATNRQLSVLHPIYKLLYPHYRDTMNINALARHILINEGGFFEKTVFPGKYALEISSKIYEDWDFTEQALPCDLVKRGVAVEDQDCPHGLRLLIEDYPYAVDGLEVWSAIETWATEYCSFYYPTDELIRSDTELQSWWWEIRNVGHGDMKDKKWWPNMQTRADLTKTCTIIIWVASALHAAVNFGQYAYAGFLPNRPTISRRFMPEAGTPEYEELKTNPDVVLLKTITPQLQTLLGVSLIEILSRHSTDEIYLGQRDTPEWTSDAEPLRAFERFGARLREIERIIAQMNQDERWKNRTGPVKMEYTLLYPNTSDYSKDGGLTGKGIPNSVSI